MIGKKMFLRFMRKIPVTQKDQSEEEQAKIKKLYKGLIRLNVNKYQWIETELNKREAKAAKKTKSVGPRDVSKEKAKITLA